jgi:acetyl esterase/lipase
MAQDREVHHSAGAVPPLTRRTFLAGVGVTAGAAWLASCGLFDDDVERIDYGSAPSQFGELFLPGGDGPHPTVVVVHGGSWSTEVDRTATRDISRWLADHGWAAWNLEYRRVDEGGGGWPGTLEDVAAGVDHLAVLADDGRPVDPGRTILLGHSAGGQLALWAAARPGLGAGDPGASPAVTCRAAVSMAGVTDLAAASQTGGLSAATEAFLGGSPTSQPGRYAVASPVQRVPLGVPQLVAQALQDTVVPLSMGRIYAGAAQQNGDTVELLELDQTNHFSFLDPNSNAWQQVSRRLSDLAPAQP